jgi:mRNA interferase RelE/StbE
VGGRKEEKAIQKRIGAGMAGLLEIPPVGDIVKLKGQQGVFRLRVGTFRIVYQIDYMEKIVYVIALDNRGDIY